MVGEEKTGELDVFRVIWGRKKGIMIFCISGIIAAFIISFALPKIYEADSMILVSPPVEDLSGVSKKESSVSAAPVNMLNMRSYMQLATTPQILSKVIEALGLRHGQTEEPMYVETLRSMVRVEDPEGKVLSVAREATAVFMSFKVRGANPETIKNIANTWTQVLAEASRSMRAAEEMAISKATYELYDTVKMELEEVEDQLNVAEKKHQVKLKNRLLMFYLGRSGKDQREYLDLKNEVSDTELRFETLKEQYARGQELLKEGESSVGEASRVSFFKSRQMFSQMKLKKEMNGVEVELKPMRPTLAALDKSVEEWKVKIPVLHGKILEGELEIKRLREKAGKLEKAFETLTEKVRRVKAREVLKTSDVRFVSEAIEPKYEISPNRPRIIFFSGLGCFVFSCIVAVLREHLCVD